VRKRNPSCTDLGRVSRCTLARTPKIDVDLTMQSILRTAATINRKNTVRAIWLGSRIDAKYLDI
jgi:hypothetical protein